MFSMIGIIMLMEGLRHRLPALFRRVAWAAKIPFKESPGAIPEPLRAEQS